MSKVKGGLILKRISIQYNPYLQQTIMKLGSSNISTDSEFSKYLNCPLASWVDANPNENWLGFLPQLKNETKNDSEYEITFKGREIDFVDFKKAIELQKRNTKIKLIKEILFSDEDMMKRVDNVYHQLLSDQFKEIIESTNSTSLKASYSTLPSDYENLKNNEFRIAVVGTYSSGKSTVINALIGQEILPSADKACTNKVWRVKHQKGIVNCLVSAFDGSNNTIYDKVKFTPDIAKELGAEECAAKSVEIFTDLSHLYPDDIVNGLNLVIIDTPGSDNDDDGDDLKVTKSILESKGKEMLLYVYNTPSALTSGGSAILLDMISEAMSASNDTNNDRFLFVLNRCDQLEIQGTDSIEDKIHSCIQHLAKHKIDHPRIFPAASKVSKAIKIKERGQILNPYDQLALMTYTSKLSISDDYQFENYASLPEAVKAQINESLKCAQEETAATEIYNNEVIKIHSGFVSLEYAIKDYLLKYAYPLKIRNMLNSFRAILSEVQMWENVKKNFAESLQKSGEEKNEAQENQRQEEEKISAIEEKLQAGDFAKDIKDKIDNICFDSGPITKLWAQIYPRINEIANSKIISNNQNVSAEYARSILRDVEQEENQLLLSAISKSDEIINCDIKSKICELLAQYKLYLDKMQKDGFFNLESFKFQNTVAFDELLKIDEQALVNRSKKINYARVDAHNSDRDWDWGRNFFTNIKKKFTAPRTVKETVSYESVDVENMLHKYVNQLVEDLQDNVKKINIGVKHNIDNLKQTAKRAMDECETAILDKLRERAECLQSIAKLQEDQKALDKQMQKIEERLHWIQQLYVMIKELLEPSNTGYIKEDINDSTI